MSRHKNLGRMVKESEYDNYEDDDDYYDEEDKAPSPQKKKQNKSKKQADTLKLADADILEIMKIFDGEFQKDTVKQVLIAAKGIKEKCV